MVKTIVRSLRFTLTGFIFMSVISELFFLFLVGSSDQTWSLGQGHEDQNLGTHLPLLSSHQGKYHLFYSLGFNDTIYSIIPTTQ